MYAIRSYYEKYDNSKTIFSLILIDIDNFKFVNDDYGHLSGDTVLKKVADILKETLRKDDIICRWGGEEILVLLNDTKLDDAKSVAEKIRSNVESDQIELDEKILKITITAGVCSSDKSETICDMINSADKCLYKGKASGKNCVVACE